jgi:hypothetical protein
MKLSRDRARIVKNYLVSQEVNKKLISVKAFGGAHPLSQELNKINRRVEILVVENPALQKIFLGHITEIATNIHLNKRRQFKKTVSILQLLTI